jgi:hypothetical protein
MIERNSMKTQQELILEKLTYALLILDQISLNKPTLMHTTDGHEVVVYPLQQNPTMIAREALAAIKALC